MDNLTHSIIGFGAGELVHRSLRPEAAPQQQRTRHRLLLVAGALASNFPDLDLFLTHQFPAPLGYLLHHRGITHTLPMLLPQALLLLLLLWLCWPSARALLRASVPARAGLGAAVLAGLGLHLLMDFTNSYGVHPLYPFDGRWFYGDMVFIVEPLYWVAVGLPLAFIMRWPWLRFAALGGLGTALLAVTLKGYLLWPSLLVLLALGVACGAAQRYADRAGGAGRQGLLLALGVCLGFCALQSVASDSGRRDISAALARIDPGAQVLDVAMTAFPSQPLCWNFVSVQRDDAAGIYRLRRGTASVAPQWLAQQACPAGLMERGTATVLAPGLVKSGQVTSSLQVLRALDSGNCDVDAWLRFGRAPALVDKNGEEQLSDYRFASTPRGNFTTLQVERGERLACQPDIPAWGYPRADLLTPRAALPAASAAAH